MQGLVCGFVGGDPSALTARRTGDPFAALVASLSPRVWIDAHNGTYLTLSGSDINSATDRSGSGNHAAQTGAARPSYDAGALGGRGGIVFAGTQYLETPSFSVATGSTSGCCYWHPTADSGAFGFAGFSSHVTLLAVSGGMYVLAPGATSEGTAVASFAVPHRVVWRTVAGGASRVIVDGVTAVGAGANTAIARSGTLKIGCAAPPAFYFATGAIGEIVFSDTEWTNAQMNEMDAAMAARWS